MSEERFDRIDATLKTIQQRFDVVDRRFDAVNDRLDSMDRRFDEVDERLDIVDHRLEVVDQRLDAVDHRLDHVDSRIEDLDRHMHVLHEDAIGRIAATYEYTGPTREEFLELKEMIGRRLDPLESAVRQHSVEIDRLKQRLT